MKNRFTTGIALPCLLAGGLIPALSLTAVTSAAAEPEQLEAIVISAGRTPLETEKVGRATTVITGASLETSQVRYVADALRQVPGVAVSRTGSFGGLTQIRLRGSESNHVLVLIDGVEVASSSSGEYDFGGLQVSDIDRIEVLRGPQGALYGSNATSGVIHIVTKGGIRNGHRITTRSEVGTDKTVLTDLLVQGGNDRIDGAFSATLRRTDGFNISDYGKEKDGDRNVTLNGKVRADLTETLVLDANLRFVTRKSDTDDQDFAFPDRPTQGQVIDTFSHNKTREVYGGAGLTWSLFEDLFVQRARVEYTDLHRRGLNSNNRNGNDDNRLHLSYQGTLAFQTESFLQAAHSLTGAVEWERETYRNAYPGSPDQGRRQQRDLSGYVGEYRLELLERIFLSGALRYDRNEQFKDTLTYNASAAYLHQETGTRVHASIGTGVTNPTFFEQFGFQPSRFVGNPNLTPEENFGWDIGVEQKLLDERLTVDVTYFRERLEDEIQTRFLPGFASSPFNLQGTSKRQGVEVSATAQILDSLTARASYTYLDAREPNGQKEVRRPMHSGAAGLQYTFLDGRASAFVDAVYNGQQMDSEWVNATPRSRVKLDDYLLVNLGADYKLNDNFTLYGRVENAFDQTYEEVYGYNTQGATAFVGIKGTF
ncbi:TonB-dependent receptor plug domain-containing protein [Pannonibacter tanglangensis]|uniref:TonB-dependent receptor n=1 Tax=Pannonibacter tanglangensis TaxID=2750084 RepID=A0ABW9ZET4_9HYPH|nr:TonB-dependent receptor [Pannonibacter sp. XCT-34]NBN63183.1 TonB-dependent receptor [Pannonibacter sp. XCT-34]